MRNGNNPMQDVPASLLSLLTGWMQQGVESFSATQRIFGEVAMRQNAAATKAIQNGIADADHSPVEILSRLAAEGTSSFIEAQKILLRLVQQENEIVMNGVKERIDSTPGVAMAELLRRSLDTFIRMQQEFLKTTDKQTTQWLEAVKKGAGYQGAELVDLAREEMGTFIQAQKRFLEVVEQETMRATGRHTLPKTKMKKTDLPKLANAATDAFIEAQKRLLEVMSQQMNINLEVAGRAIDLVSPSRLLPVADLTGEGVKTFVGAEKALIEAMIQGRPAGKVKRPASRHARHTTHRGKKTATEPVAV